MKHQLYTIEKLAEIAGGELKGAKNVKPFEYITFDSRKIPFPEKSIFFAFKSERRNGHDFVEELYDKGLRNFVVEKEFNISKYPKGAFLLVSNTIAALHLLAISHRKQFQIPIIAITGSNGKTIIKEWLYQLLESDYNIVRNPKSFNSQIGVPLSIWHMDKENTMGIFEAGISQQGEMEKLKKMIEPKIGLFTNIGHAHDEGFLNIRQKVNEKLNLFTNTDVVIYCKDHHEISENVTAMRARTMDMEVKNGNGAKVFTWSKSSEADLFIKSIENDQQNAHIEGEYKGHIIDITIPFNDEASIENAIHCWAIMLYLGIDNKIIKNRMTDLAKVAMRLELKKGVNSCSLINDSYNSDIESLKIALDFLNHQKQHIKKTVILSDILQSGKPEIDLYNEVAGLVNKNGVNRLVGIGRAISKQNSCFSSIDHLEKSFFQSTEEFLNNMSPDSFKDETILLKGARTFMFEKISNLLEEKRHETLLEINLNALEHNLNCYRSLLKPETKIAVMVKAFSYGSGSFEIANLLSFLGVDFLAVAFVDEGVELRKAGISLPIIVMNPEQKSFGSMISYNLEPEVYSMNLLRQFEVALKEYGGSAPLPFPIHIKLDTGMHRLGFVQSDLEELSRTLKDNPVVSVNSVFSHLAGSDDSKHDNYTKQQISNFKKMTKKLQGGSKEPILMHILNSAGIVRFPDAEFDMVRLGLGLYGVDTSNTIQKDLRNVSTLKTSVAQIKEVAKGESIGYDRSFIATKKMKVAIVRLGYADGLNRKLGNGNGSLLVKGVSAKIVGNICMDMTIIDVSKIKDIKEGDEVIVFGEEQPIQKVAELLQTIPYEVMTGISKRVKRIYFQE